MNKFQRFVGIDWSGASGARQAGIQVAEIELGWLAPRLVAAPGGGNWSRTAVMNYLLQADERPTLFGIDCAFSVPWGDAEDLFGSNGLSDVKQLWALVDAVCSGAPGFYAGPIWSTDQSPFRPYIYHPASGRGDRYRRDRLRYVEQRAGGAISVYHMVGPQVGAGSFAGMRMLHAISKAAGRAVAIWPFDSIERARHVVAEIYPSFFYRKAGARRPRQADLRASNCGALDRALAFYDIGYDLGRSGCSSVDQSDALISAAALRTIACRGGLFPPEALRSDPREGWIFGIPPAQSICE
jgi:hypothetical protein